MTGAKGRRYNPSMSVVHFTRYRMEIDLSGVPAVPELPDGYYWVPWDDSLLTIHAEVHYRAFHDCIDRYLFPCFSDRDSCWFLLREIRDKPGFMPQATWLIGAANGCVATIQCIEAEPRVGSIQNVGVLPRHRHQGLGQALILQALHGFHEAGLKRAWLDVTAENEQALRLYQRLGFRMKEMSIKEIHDWKLEEIS